MPAELDRHVQSIASALTVLDAFTGDEALSLSELHERTELKRSRILRISGTLISAGYLEYNPKSKTYRLGLKLFRIGRALSDRFSSLADFVRPSLRRLAAESGNTAFYSIIQGQRRMVVAKEESKEGIRFFIEEGESRPLHLGATGKVLLANAEPSFRNQFIAQMDGTNGGINRTAMENDLAKIKREGYAVSRGEVTPLGFAVAVPVRVCDDEKVQVNALTIAGPLGKLSRTMLKTYREMLLREARYLD